MKEEPLVFGDNSLIGVATLPEAGRSKVGLLLLNAGAMHRPGPHRLYVKIARRLALDGLAALRFDFSGVGDSPVAEDGLGFRQRAVVDTRQAMDQLAKVSGADRFILGGICSGAAVSFLTAVDDERVIGCVSINARSFQRTMSMELEEYLESRANTRRVRSVSQGVRILTSGVDLRKLPRMLWARAAGVRRRRRMLAGSEEVAEFMELLAARNVRVALIYSRNDHAYDYLKLVLGRKYERYCNGSPATVEHFAGADHTFTWRASQKRLVDHVTKWITEQQTLG